MIVAWLLACGDGEGDPTTPSGALCVDAPVTTWDNFGAGFVTANCQTCHAGAAPDRHGAPEEVVFDTEEDVWAWSDRVLARATGDDADMPPQGGIPEDDRYRLEVWLACGG